MYPHTRKNIELAMLYAFMQCCFKKKVKKIIVHKYFFLFIKLVFLFYILTKAIFLSRLKFYISLFRLTERLIIQNTAYSFIY